jgi:hypothetical protein
MTEDCIFHYREAEEHDLLYANTERVTISLDL